ncbi:MAG: acyl carrier protein [Terriglobia bacterium]
MITESDVRAAIKKAVRGYDVERLGIDQDFYEAGLDSLDHASILLNLQESHGLIIADEDIDQAKTIRGILEYGPEPGA